MPMLDYDGYVSAYNFGGGLPSQYQETFDRVAVAIAELKPALVVEVGAGNCLLAAEISKLVPTIAVDTSLVPRAEGDFTLALMDATSPEFFDLLGPDVLLVARRTFCLLLSDDWLTSVEVAGCRWMFGQALDNEKHRFPNAAAEARFLTERSWEVAVDGTCWTAVSGGRYRPDEAL